MYPDNVFKITEQSSPAAVIFDRYTLIKRRLLHIQYIDCQLDTWIFSHAADLAESSGGAEEKK